MKNLNKRITFATINAPLKMEKPAPNSTPGSIATLKGIAIAYGQLSTDRGGYKVRLVPNSATFTNPTFALYQHEFNAVLGNTGNNSLRLTHSDTGVGVEIDVPDTTTGRDVTHLIDNGYIGGMSFTMANGFEESFPTKEDGIDIVNATKFTVDEVTVCANPAFTQTSIAIADPAEEDDEGEPEGYAAKQKANRDAMVKLEQYRHWLYGNSNR